MNRSWPTASGAAAAAWRRIGRPVKLSFFSALGTGLLVYLFALTNPMFCTSDALMNYTFDGNLSWMGRWSCQWLSALSTDSNMPAVNGFIMLLALAGVAALVTSLLQIRSSLLALLVGAVLVCHPSVGATLHYLHNADGYLIAALLAVLALWLCDRYRWGFLPGAALLCLSMGTYQAYLALMVALMLVRGVQLMASGRLTDKELLRRMVRYGLLAALGVGQNNGVTKLLAALGMQLSEYQSVSTMGQFTLGQLMDNFVGCYRDFRSAICFLSLRPGYYVNGYANYFLFAAGWGMMGLLVLRNHGSGSLWLRLPLLAVLALLSPMLYCSIRLANPQHVHQLMTYSTVGMHLMVIAGLALVEEQRTAAQAAEPKARPLRERLTALAGWLYSWIAPVVLAVCLLVWSVGANLDFYRGHEDYENLYAQCTNYLTLAEQTEGYEKRMPIYVVGQPDEGSALSRGQTNLHEVKSYYAFMVHVLKVQMPFGIANEIDAQAEVLRQTPAYEAMPCYPLPGSAQVIDGAMVIKLGQ